METIVNNIQIIVVITLIITIVNYIMLTIIATKKKYYIVVYKSNRDLENRTIVLHLAHEELSSPAVIINYIKNSRHNLTNVEIISISSI